MNDSPEQSADGPVKTTIVGARPPSPGRQQSDIPRGIEVLIKKASVDPAFRQLLLEKRAEAAHEIGLELTAAEAAAINAVPSAQLEQIIANAKVPANQRRAFLGGMGAAMLAALTAGLAGCESGIQTVEVGMRSTVVVTVEVGIRKEVPITTVVTPTPISGGPERLSANIASEGADSATVTVSYNSPFEAGEIIIDFRKSPYVRGASITYEPAPPVAVSKGSGEVTFHAAGSGGSTDWLIVGLRSATAECRNSPALSPPTEYKPGQLVDGCAIWQVVEHHREWSSGE
jgi:hypothetical protein